MRKSSVKFLKDLVTAPSPSGYEGPVRSVWTAEAGRHADSVTVDVHGNAIAVLNEGATPRIMLAGHMDEIGFMVTDTEEGFIRFTQVGGFDVRTLLGQRVMVHGRKELPGVIGCRPPHVLGPGERNKPVPMDKLFVDVGLTQESLAENVCTGDLITLVAPCSDLKNDLICGKAFDDRAAVVAIAVCLDTLQTLEHRWDVFGVATVQEEVGLRGAFTSTYGIVPDVGIAIDVGFAKQPGVSEPHSIELNKGPALAMGPNIHPSLFREIKAVADELEIPFQTEVAPRGTGTDANAMQLTREGIATALLSIPERNMHTPIETISVKDVSRTGRLLAHFIASLDDTFMDKLAWADEGDEGEPE